MHRPASIMVRTAVVEREHRSFTRSFACGEIQDRRGLDRLFEKCILSSAIHALRCVAARRECKFVALDKHGEYNGPRL
jgi:hypothetical protein